MSVSLNSTKKVIDTAGDSVIIKKVLIDIPGGKSLDVSGYTPTGAGIATETLSAGHVIIKHTASKVLKPLDVDNGAYVSLPSGHSYEGVLIASLLLSQPLAAVMLSGDMNEAAFKNFTGLTVPSAAKTALTHILFTED